MLVNIETNLSLKEIERLLSEKVCYEYPFFHHDYDLGINWVNNTKDLVCLFYEDGAKDRWGYQTTVKLFFYGKVIKFNNKYRIIGVSCINILFIILTLVFLGWLVFSAISFNEDTTFGILLCLLIFGLANCNISKGNKIIKKYLEQEFL